MKILSQPRYSLNEILFYPENARMNHRIYKNWKNKWIYTRWFEFNDKAVVDDIPLIIRFNTKKEAEIYAVMDKLCQ